MRPTYTRVEPRMEQLGLFLSGQQLVDRAMISLNAAAPSYKDHTKNIGA